jgi:hypothetical protein
VDGVSRHRQDDTPSSVWTQLAVLELWKTMGILRAMEFVGIRFENSVRILLDVIYLGKLKKTLQREVAPYSAVCVPVRPVQHAPF